MMLRTLLITSLLGLLAADAPPTSKPANIDSATWSRMLAIDAKSAEVQDLSADFEQQKFTAMLRKPLISSGKVFVRGSAMLWDTRKPEPTKLQITATEARIYYPSQNTIEVYQIEQKLGELAASPLPRLSTLLEHFTFEPLPLSAMGEKDEQKFLAVKMLPSEAELREHIDHLYVLLNAQTGLIERLEMTDSDGDRTLLKFSNAKVNAGLRNSDLKIDAPANVKIVHPLAAIEGKSQDAQDKQK